MAWTRNRRPKYARVVSYRKPAARSEGLLIEDVGEGLLIYDTESDRAHSLSVTAARVWRACDGTRDVEVLVSELEMDSDTVLRALDELRDSSLLDGMSANGDGITRRDLSFRAAKVGAAAAALPLIVSVAAPVPASAFTPTPAICLSFTDSDCDNCTNICGCCCCCQGGGGPTVPACKICYTTSGCSSFTCPGDTTTSHCSSKAKDPPDCDEPSATYLCKDGTTVIDVGSQERCCQYGAP